MGTWLISANKRKGSDTSSFKSQCKIASFPLSEKPTASLPLSEKLTVGNEDKQKGSIASGCHTRDMRHEQEINLLVLATDILGFGILTDTAW